MAFNRLLSFHVVRSTRPCQYVPACFIGKKEYRNLRDPGHLEKCPHYPDPQYHAIASSRSRSIPSLLQIQPGGCYRRVTFNEWALYYLNFTQKYFFRDAALRHLRLEQFNRYLYMAGENDTAVPYTAEDTVADVDEDAPPVDIYHRNYDEFMEATKVSAHFLSNARHVPGCKRRAPARLGVSRVPFIEPIGASRENFYESKLALGLAWFCEEMPTVVQDPDGNNVTE